MLNAGLIGPWRTAEYLELMSYLKERQTLSIGGFDVQRTGNNFFRVLEDLINTIEPDKKLSVRIEQRYNALAVKLQDRNSRIDSSTAAEKESLMAGYRNLIKIIDENQKKT